jgi:hypothetical protein
MPSDGMGSAPRDARARHFQVDYGVPYTRFRQRPGGFWVSFRRTSEYVFKMSHAVGDYNRRASQITTPVHPNLGHLMALLITLVIMVALRVVASVWWIADRLCRTLIIVGPVWVRVGNHRMSRAEFGGFLIHHSVVRAGKSRTVLGYQYRNRRYAFGGIWPETKAEEVASALNGLLGALPMAADAGRPSEDDLRGARPTDF